MSLRRGRVAFAALAALAHWNAGGNAGAAAAGSHFEVLGRYAAGLYGDADISALAVHPRRPVVYLVDAAAGAVEAVSLADPSRPERLFRHADRAALQSGVDVAAAGDRLFFLAADARGDAALDVLSDQGGLSSRTRWPGAPKGLAVAPDLSALAVLTGPTPDRPGGVRLMAPSQTDFRSHARFIPLADTDRDRPPAGAAPLDGPPSATWAPEDAAFSTDGAFLAVTVQNANALVVIDVEAGRVVGRYGLGTKRWSDTPFDASDRDAGVSLRRWRVRSLYQPDGVVVLGVGREAVIITANEGLIDLRRSGRVADLRLNETAFDDAEGLSAPAALGRLIVAAEAGDPDADGMIDFLFAHGGRSIAAWSVDGAQWFDSGAALELRTAAAFGPRGFNVDERGVFDAASDELGPRPEKLAATPDGRLYVSLKDAAAIAEFDVSNPKAPEMIGLFSLRLTDPRPGDFGDDRSIARIDDLLWISAVHARGADPLLIAVGPAPRAVTILRAYER